MSNYSILRIKIKYYHLKRFFDILFSFLLLILLMPIMAITFLIIFVDLGEWPIFIHIRPGYKTKDFPMLKFKTMKSYNPTRYPTEESRITSISRLIRKLRIDETPQLLNILRNEMSFVGPRPLLKKYLKVYKQEYFRRHDVLPGVTGLAQISGSEKLPFDKRIEFDLKYIDNNCFKNDFFILIYTVIYVIKISFTVTNQDSLPKFPN